MPHPLSRGSHSSHDEEHVAMIDRGQAQPSSEPWRRRAAWWTESDASSQHCHNGCGFEWNEAYTSKFPHNSLRIDRWTLWIAERSKELTLAALPTTMRCR